MARKSSLLVTSCSVFALLSGAALAEQMADTDGHGAGIDEVTINSTRPTDQSSAGTKTDIPLIDTPQSISVISAEEMVDRGMESLNQALRYSSGISPDTRGGTATRYDQLNIRGFDATQYLDGMPLLGGAYYAIPQIDVSRLERVDVVRGPASVLYGSASPGGIVALTSKLPTAGSFGDVSVTGGTYGEARGTFDVGGAVDPEQKVLVRLNGMVERSDGQIDHTENKRYSINPSITFRPDDKTSWTILYSWQQDPAAASYGSAPPQGSVLPNPHGDIPTSFYDGEPGFETFDRSQSAVTSLFERDIDDNWKFRSSFRYLRTESTYRSVYGNGLEADLMTLDRWAGAAFEGADAYTTDNHVTGHIKTGAVDHDLLVGVDYQHLRQSLIGGFSNVGVPSINIYNPVYGTATIPTPALYMNDRIRQEQTGAYIQDQMSLGGLHLLLSGRHDWFDMSETGTDPAGQATTHDTGRVGLLYHFENGIAPYVSYATSFEPQTATDKNNKALGPTTGKQTEIGIKYQPDRWDALFTAALYDLAKQNVATSDPNAGPDHPYASIAAGEIRSKGLELEARGKPLPNLDLSASYTYVDNRITKDNTPGNVGTHPYGVPKQTASAWAHYTIDQGPADGLGGGVGVRYLGSSSDGDGAFIVPSATLVDLSVDYDLVKLRPDLNGMSLSVSVTNLADERYVSSCYFTSWCWFGPGRTALATIRYHW